MSKKKKSRNKTGRTKTMTEKALAANRENAQASTGANTPEGKETVSRNAGKLFLFSPNPVAPWESFDDFTDFRAAFEAEWQPVGATQYYLFDRMVAQMWRLMRVYTAETNLLCIAQDQEFLSTEREKLSRYEMRIDGNIRRLRRDLLALKDALRARQRERSEADSHKVPEAALVGTAVLGEPEVPQWEPTTPDEFSLPPLTPDDILTQEERQARAQAGGPHMGVYPSSRPRSNKPSEVKRRDILQGLADCNLLYPTPQVNVRPPDPPPEEPAQGKTDKTA